MLDFYLGICQLSFDNQIMFGSDLIHGTQVHRIIKGALENVTCNPESLKSLFCLMSMSRKEGKGTGSGVFTIFNF